MSSKYAIVAIIVLSAVLFIGIMRGPAQADDTFEVKSTSIYPDPAMAGEPLEFTVELLDETNVTGVFINICTDLNCFPPFALEKGMDDIWRGSTDVIEEPMEYHYSVAVQYENDTLVYTDYIYFDAVSHDLATSSIEMAPSKVMTGSEVDVYVKLNDTDFLDEVTLQYSQGGDAFDPVVMTLGANGTYSARIGPFDSTDEVTYNVTATYKDGDATWTSWTQDISFKPQKEATDDDGGLLPAMGAVAVLAVLAGLAVTRRSRMGRP